MTWLTYTHSPLCYNAEFGRSALKDVSINTGEWEAWLSPRYTPLSHKTPPHMCYMCYHVKFGSSASKGICMNGSEPKNWVALGPCPLRRAQLTPRNTPLPHMYYPTEFGRSRSNGTSVIEEIRLKIDPSHSAFQGHSRSSEPTWIDLPPMTGYISSIATTGIKCC